MTALSATAMPDTPATGQDPELRQLLADSVAGDTTAFRTLYERTSPRLYAVAMRITRRPDLAEDVLQDAYVSMWRGAAQQREDASVLAWMVTIVRHRAIDLLRAQREHLPAENVTELPDPGADVEQALLAGAASAAVRRCMEALDPSARQAILLAYYRGFTQEEVATHVAAPLGTVKSWMRRALLRLRRCLDR